jgi:hypothetical protein
MGTRIRGIEGLTTDQLNFELQRGAKFVLYQYCFSVVVMTFKRGSDIYFIRNGENAVVKGLPFSLISLLAGWWGIPWGPIWTISTAVNNFRGGKDVTAEVIASFNRPTPAPAVPPIPGLPAR